jgi:endoglucanase
LLGSVDPPVDAAAQMKHFVNDDKLNAFRLPVGWQYLVNNQLGGTLDAGNLAKYDGLVQSCLSTGAYCIIDIHNYARWNGQIIGQGGPKDDDFAGLWSQLATKYAAESKVVMGLMNEPHDSMSHLPFFPCDSSAELLAVPDMTRWATSVQAVVTAIRKAGATTQTILLPGNCISFFAGVRY